MTKIAITIDKELLVRLDHLVAEQWFARWSQAIQDALREKLDRMDHSWLARECAKLHPHEPTSLRA
jgi:metal-responsive CopG/Arc/MetJ family transcriptional regulator